MRTGQACAHFQSVGLHQVKWPEQAIQAGKNAQVILSKIDIHGRKAIHVEARVDITLEGEDGRPRILRRERLLPGTVACGIEFRQPGTELHQPAKLLDRQATQYAHQCCSLVHEQRCAMGDGATWRFKIKRFCR